MYQQLSEADVQTAIHTTGAPVLTFDRHPEQEGFILYCKNGWAFARTPRDLKRILRQQTRLYGKYQNLASA